MWKFKRFISGNVPAIAGQFWVYFDIEGENNLSITLKEIGEKVGVSKSTVHRALQNQPMISFETKEKVLQAVKEYNYEPNVLARGLLKVKTYTLGVIITDIGSSYYSKIVRGIEDEAEKRDYSVLLYNSDRNIGKLQRCIKELKRRAVDGIMIAPFNDETESFQDLKREKFPFILFNSEIKMEAEQVFSDDLTGAFMMTEYLIKLGHRRIGYITTSMQDSQAQSKLEGYKMALQKYNLDWDDALVETCTPSYTRESEYNATNNLLKMRHRPSAIFAVSDFVALGALEAAKEAGLMVPRDISIAGYDDREDIISLVKPRLTTVATPKEELGIAATKALIKEIDREEKEREYSSIKLKPRLVIRESVDIYCGDCPPGKG